MADSQMAGPGENDFPAASDKTCQKGQDSACGTIGQEPGPAGAKAVRSQIHGSKGRTRRLVQIIGGSQLGRVQASQTSPDAVWPALA